MAKNTTPAREFKPTTQQAKLIKLATRKQGVTRPEVRKALDCKAGANIPVQIMLKNLAARAGYTFNNDYEIPSTNGGDRWMTVYSFTGGPAQAMAMKTKTAARKRA